MIWIPRREPDGALTLFGVRVLSEYEAEIVAARGVGDDGEAGPPERWHLSPEAKREVCSEALCLAAQRDAEARAELLIAAAEARP